MGAFQTAVHRVDFCVVGGGLAGLCAAVAAARNGLSVALMQDRPMLGGNASSEIRMWALGAKGRDKQETGIIEEMMLENYYRNPTKNYSIWDSVLYETARFQDGLTLLLNCSCMDAAMDGDCILSVTGWQTTTQQYHTVEATLFADCSGDSVLAPLTGALYRVGHEAREEFDEDIAPAEADRKTMGMSILIQARETDSPKTYIPPFWAEKFTKDMLPYRVPDVRNDGENFWYLELGGVRDSIADTEALRDELLAVAYGMWDYVKNDPENRERFANFDLDWIGFLPGKRESRRYVGDYIMTQGDVRTGGQFDDVIAYGGWPMDDHHPEGFRTAEKPTIFHPAPSPFGVPYRCLYSKNIKNLFMAGRNISITHTALSSTRVMATCAILGQAAGTAAVVAMRHGIMPRELYPDYVPALQALLMEDDCWLPGRPRKPSAITGSAALSVSQGDAEVLRNGIDRPVDGADNGLRLAIGEKAAYRLASPAHVKHARLVFDSDLNRDTQPDGSLYKRPMYATYYLHAAPTHVPKTLVRDFRIHWTLPDGTSASLDVKDNHQRLVYVPIERTVKDVSLEILATWGAEDGHVFAFDLA